MIHRYTYSSGSKFWYIHNRRLGIVELLETGKLRTPLEDGLTLRIYGHTYPNEVPDDGTDMDDPIDVHVLAERAVIAKLISDLYQRGDSLDPERSSYFHRVYAGEINTAMKTINKQSNFDTVRGI